MNNEAVRDLIDLAFWPILSATIVLVLTGNLGLSAALFTAFGVLLFRCEKMNG